MIAVFVVAVVLALAVSAVLGRMGPLGTNGFIIVLAACYLATWGAARFVRAVRARQRRPGNAAR
jgi:hypothetical protein